MISLQLTPNAEKLRVDFQIWLKANPPPRLPGKVELQRFVEESQRWQSRLAKERWIGVHWPEEYGGRGLTIVEEAVIQECLAAMEAPQLVNLFGLTMVGPVLIRYGSADQKKRFLPKILNAEEIWCQGFSEPQAGSDLASLRTVATIQSDGTWEIRGQKIWTSFAQFSKYCFLLARTDPHAPKHKGLSYFLVPMEQNGIEIRPLTQITGEKEFNEVFFDDARVSPELLVGKPGDGWQIAISTLMYERVVLTFGRHLQSDQALRELAHYFANGPTERGTLRSYGSLVATDMAVRALALSHLVQYSETVVPGAEGSFDKLGWSEHFQRVCSFALDTLGTSGVRIDAPNSSLSSHAAHRYLYSRGRTIAAGTSEIQRNVIAERVLGLPKERQATEK